MLVPPCPNLSLCGSSKEDAVPPCAIQPLPCMGGDGQVPTWRDGPARRTTPARQLPLVGLQDEARPPDKFAFTPLQASSCRDQIRDLHGRASNHVGTRIAQVSSRKLAWGLMCRLVALRLPTPPTPTSLALYRSKRQSLHRVGPSDRDRRLDAQGHQVVAKRWPEAMPCQLIHRYKPVPLPPNEVPARRPCT
jgi:hypothetical protein